MGFKNYVNNIQPLRPGAGAVLKIECGPNAPTLDKLQFMLAGTDFDVTKVNGITCYASGKEFYFDVDGVTHNKRREYLGLAVDDSELVLDFTEPNARSAIEQNLSCLPLSMMSDFRVKLMVDASTDPDLELTCLAHYRAPTANPFIKKMRVIDQAFAAGGVQPLFLPNGPTGGKLIRAWIHEGTPGNIKSVELRARNSIGIEATRDELEFDQAANGLVPQAGVVVLDFVADGNMGGWLDTAKLSEVMLKINGTAADAYQVFLEYTDELNRL